jgi:hypothetical protein
MLVVSSAAVKSRAKSELRGLKSNSGTNENTVT